MTPFHLGPIDKALAHKVKDENVFVRDLRRAIPGVLPRQTVESVILPRFSDADKRFFLAYYQLSEVRPDEDFYVLFDLPHELPERLFGDHVDALTPQEQRTVRRYYTAGSGGIFRLSGTLTPQDNVVLTRIFEHRGLSLSEGDRTGLANLLESVADLELEEVYHAGLNVDPTHAFFFEHPNEHVPGMMLLEAARQFALACWHLFGHIAVRDSQFIMNELKAVFRDYVNLNYPATFKAEIKTLTKRRSGEWHQATLLVTTVQQGAVCAEMEFPAQVISKRSFQRLRADRQHTDPLHRFHPIENVHHELVLWNVTRQKYFRAKLWDISMEGFRATMIDAIDDTPVPERWEAILYFEELGFIRSDCSPLWQRRERETHWAGFHFLDMSSEDRMLLQSAIRQYCHVRSEREHL
jgi:hypothetical protein